MFLGRLEPVEKEAFICLTVKAAEANGYVDDNEYVMLEEYCKEMGIAFFDARNLNSMEEVEKVFSQAENQNKKIAILEIIGLMYADGDYDEKEKSFVNSFAEAIGISEECVKSLEENLVKYIDITKNLMECIE